MKPTMLSAEATVILQDKVTRGESLTQEEALNLCYSALTNGQQHHRYYWGAMAMLDSEGFNKHFFQEQERQLKKAITLLREEAEDKCAIRDETVKIVEEALASTRPGGDADPYKELKSAIEKLHLQLQEHNCRHRKYDEKTKHITAFCTEEKPCTMHALERLRRVTKGMVE